MLILAMDRHFFCARKVLQITIQIVTINNRKVVLYVAGKSANVSVRVEPDIKAQAEAILASLGVSTSTFVNMAYRQVILRQGIPFAVELPAESAEIKTRDTMSDAEFDTMIQTGLEQAKTGKSIPVDVAFDNLMQRL